MSRSSIDSKTCWDIFLIICYNARTLATNDSLCCNIDFIVGWIVCLWCIPLLYVLFRKSLKIFPLYGDWQCWVNWSVVSMISLDNNKFKIPLLNNTDSKMFDVAKLTPNFDWIRKFRIHHRGSKIWQMARFIYEKFKLFGMSI